MSYKDKKQEILIKRDSILEKYYSLLKDVLEFGHELNNMDMEITNEAEAIDLKVFIINDLAKTTRLMAALLYVEEPQDKEVIGALKENISINKKLH